VSGHRLAITIPGQADGTTVATGETVYAPGHRAEAAAWLPHSCEEWVIGEGTPARVIADLQALRDEIDLAIVHFQTATA
jgi:hypothetical protein